METTNFRHDNKKGLVGENIFIKYLQKNNIPFYDARKDKRFQNADVDFVTEECDENYAYEVKTTWKNKNFLVFEILSNCNQQLGDIRKGWAEVTQANYLIFVCPSDRKMCKLDWNNETKWIFKQWVQKGNIEINKPTTNKMGIPTHQSCYLEIPISEFEGYIAYLN